MALYSERALLKMMNKQGKTQLRDDRWTGLYYEDPKRGKQYVVIGKQMGGQVYTTNPKRQERKLTKKKHWYPEDKKVEAATLHVATGNLKRVSELTKVPVGTLQRWTDEDWWWSTQQRVKREAIEETDAKFSKLIDKAIEKLNKAVEEGDYIYDIKRGTLARVPMTGRDLAIVAGTTFDKRQLLRGEATRITKTSDPEKHLAELARKFAELVRGPEEKIVQGETLDAQSISGSDDPLISRDSLPAVRRSEFLYDQLSGRTVQAQEDDGDAGDAAPAKDAADAHDALSAEAISPAGDQQPADESKDAGEPSNSDEESSAVRQRIA